MSIINIENELHNNSYPGRGIIIGKSADGENAVIAYFIMGRSENSRNRIFVLDGENLKTKAFDESKVVDPALIIYFPVRVIDNKTIVTNGDQTDTIVDFIKKGKIFEDALRTREFEPDSPNYTPRISSILDVKDNDFTYKFSILKSLNGNPNSCIRFFYEYSQPISGQGHFISTYKCDGNPLPSYEGEPKTVEMGSNIDELSNILWNSLNEENKVSLFTRFINLKTGKTETKIINKNI